MYEQTFLEKLNRKFGRFAIRNLMAIIVCGMAAVFLLDLYLTYEKGIYFSSYLTFDRAAILSGQFWRILSFIFLPPDSSVVFIVFSLCFYWLIGSALENQWGSFRFDLFYLCGILATIAVGFITGYALNDYLNLSLFFAFALVYPDFQIMLFFLVPIKVKYLAFIDAVYFLWMLVTEGWRNKIVLLIAIANVLLFFGRDFVSKIRSVYRRYKYRRDANQR